MLARANGCRCEEYRLVQAKLEAERKLADAQVSNRVTNGRATATEAAVLPARAPSCAAGS